MSRRGPAVAVALLFVLIIGLQVWIHVVASCSQIGWLPVKDQPGRCITVDRR